MLLVAPGHRLARDHAIDLLWPELSPDRVRGTWYQALSSLRRVLEPDLEPRQESAYLTIDGATLAIAGAVDLWTDLDAFETGLRAASAEPPDAQRGRLRAALALYRGDLLAEEPAEWVIARREAQRLAWQQAVVQLAALDLQAGDPLTSVAALQAVIAADRTSEEAHRALIGAYIAAGDRDKALRQYEQCRQALRDDLDIEPEAPTRQLVADCIVRDRPATAAGPVKSAPPTWLPPVPLTSFIGRDREVAMVEDLLWRSDVRLLTLTGPGGVGKTRLAVEIGHRFAQEQPVVFVALAGVRSPGLVLTAIGQALGARPTQGETLLSAIARRLAGHDLLLVLDNFEHVAAAADAVVGLLAQCPRLTVLATSRAPLHLGGEHVVTVPPLSLPGARRPSLAALARSEAVALFVERAAAARAGFALTEQNASDIAQLCARLDGLPLAIELAAARARILSPRAILARLDKQLDLLIDGPRDVPVRLRTMRGAIGWSYDLLDERERAAFCRMSVFAGGAALPAAAWVTADGGPLADIRSGEAPDVPAMSPMAIPKSLATLVDHSLLQQEEGPDGEPRFVMLETIRAFALERLQERGEDDAAQRRHLEYLLAFARATAPGLTHSAQAAEVDRLADEIDNIRAALTWGLARGAPGSALTLALATYQLWFMRAMPGEGRRWLEEALTAAPAVTGAERTDALLGMAALAYLQGDGERHHTLSEEALVVARAADYQFGSAVAEFQLGVAAEWRHEFAAAAARYEAALLLMRNRDDPYWIALLLSNLGDINLWRGRIAEAAALADEGLAHWQAMGNEWGIAQGLGTVAAVASRQGDQVLAAQLYRQSLTRWLALEDWRGIAGALAGLADLAETGGQLRPAARLLGAARALGNAAAVSNLAHHVQYERAVVATRAQLDAWAFEEEWAAGNAFTLARAIAEAQAVYESFAR